MRDDMTSGKEVIETIHGRVFQEIVVEYPSYCIYPEYKGKPYFSIKYTENGQGYIGYGTYKPEVLSECLKEYFMPSAQPQVIKCKDCKHWKKTIGDERWSLGDCDVFDKKLVMCEGFCSWGVRREEDDG